MKKTQKNPKFELITPTEVIIFGKKFMSKKEGWYYPTDSEGKYFNRVDKKEVLRNIKQHLHALDKVGQTNIIGHIRLSSRTAAFALFNGELDRKANFVCKGKWVECTTTLNGHPRPHLIRIYPEIEEGIFTRGNQQL